MAAEIFVISDTHFGHTNMALNRGFNSVEEHDELIVSRWNNVITKRDTVYILGDITMEKANYEILDRLKGYKKVVLGNHDQPQHVRNLLQHVNSVCGSYTYKNCILTHIPIHVESLERYRYNVHGHLHEEHLLDDRYINTCCEVQDYTPYNLRLLIELRAKTRHYGMQARAINSTKFSL